MRLSERVRLITIGPQRANVAAIRTSTGIVLIDSGESLEVGRAIRAVLAREFSGAAVTLIVNTHAHWDHVLGNAAFPEATIVAHENSPKAMVRFEAPSGAGERGEEQRPNVAPPPLPGMPPPPPRTPLEVHLTPEVYDLTVPDATFAEDTVLTAGGTTVSLIYYGDAHARSDLLALVPDERLLFVGDLFFRETLPAFSERVRPDVARWRRALDRVLSTPGAFDRVIPGHGGAISRAEFEAQVDYLFRVWARAGEAVRGGRSLESLQEELRLERAFPDLAPFDVKSSTGGSLHEGNVRNAFRHQRAALHPATARRPYLGEAAPGSLPIVFGEGVISDAGYRLHGSPTFSPDLTEIYWAVVPPRVMTVRENDGAWSGPAALEQTAGGPQAPFFSADGRLYFQASLPGGHGSVDLWFSERAGSGWGPPRNLGAPVNSPRIEGQPSFTADGTLYFTGFLDGVWMERGIYRAERSETGYSSPELLPATINSPYLDYTPFVDAAERYLLFASSRPERDEKNLRLFVAWRLGERAWSAPVDLSGVLGIEEPARFPTVSPDGRFLFYLAGNRIYWVDASVIDDTAPAPGARPMQDAPAVSRQPITGRRIGAFM